MAVTVLYMPLLQFSDANGVPVPGAKVYSYAAGTDTPKALYGDAAGVSPLTNPAICDASGRLLAFVTVGEGYKFNVTDANDVEVSGFPIDNLVFYAQGARGPQGDPGATGATGAT